VSNAPSPTSLSPLSLHDALPISHFVKRTFVEVHCVWQRAVQIEDASYIGTARFESQTVDHANQSIELVVGNQPNGLWFVANDKRSEEHTSELQSRFDLVCRLLLE